ncbi:MAG: hypothetical protein GY856_39885 [bacterium]|nr:hypothetical protein [bacterium]
MIFSDFRKRLPEAELAALVCGLQSRGLAVGPGDAARIELLFRHAGGWSHQRCVRALKMLLAHSDEERRVIEQLAPHLFIHAGMRSQELEQERPAEQRKAGTSYGGDSAVPASEPWKFPGVKSRQRWLAGIAVLVAIALGIVLTVVQLRPADSRMEVLPDETEVLPAETEVPSGSGAAPSSSGGTALSLPRWSVGLIVALSMWLLVFAGQRLRRSWNIDQLVRSEGPRTYHLDLPAQRSQPLNGDTVREAAFHLAAPLAAAIAPWLDSRLTVDETSRNAGRLTLCYDTWREHRPLLFIEDVSPSMACWPDFGRQLAEGLVRQGCSFEHFFINGIPENVFRDRDLRKCVALEQVLTEFDNPLVVVLSDAASVDESRAAEHGRWLGILTRAIWFHPGTVEVWTPGTRWLAERLKVVPMTDEDLLRLDTPQRNDKLTFGRWRPPQTLNQAAEARIAALRGSLGEATFWWLAAGAVLDKVGELNTRLWLALLSEGVAPASRSRIGRVWALNEVDVTGSGRVLLSTDLREGLIACLIMEKPDLLSRVVAWAERLIVADQRRIATGTIAAVEARTVRACLLRIDPCRRSKARQQRRKLISDGFGEWVEGDDARAERSSSSLIRGKMSGLLDRLFLWTPRTVVAGRFGQLFLREPAAVELTGRLGWLIQLFQLDVFGDSLLSRRVRIDLGMVALLFMVVFVYDLTSWTLLFNLIFQGEVLVVNALTGATLFVGLLFAWTILIYERQFFIGDTWGSRWKILRAMAVRAVVQMITALVTIQPIVLIIFTGAIERGIHAEGIRAESVRCLGELRLNEVSGSPVDPGRIRLWISRIDREAKPGLLIYERGATRQENDAAGGYEYLHPQYDFMERLRVLHSLRRRKMPRWEGASQDDRRAISEQFGLRDISPAEEVAWEQFTADAFRISLVYWLVFLVAAGIPLLVLVPKLFDRDLNIYFSYHHQSAARVIEFKSQR